MIKEDFKGVLAEKCIKDQNDESHSNAVMAGSWIDEDDYFSLQKKNMMRSFETVTLQDDLMTAIHPERLM